jgi:hypothetical protein
LDEKEQLLNSAVENNMTLFFEHDIKYECCTVEKTNKGFSVKNTFALKDFID